MTRGIRRPIHSDEEKRITLELSISNTPRGVKRALQDVCSHYEKRRFFSDATNVRQLIHSHLNAQDVFVRRWALKAVALIGNPDDLYRIAERTRIETDYEAVTWATAALFKNAGDLTLRDIQSRTGLDNDKPLLLAARLYARPQWVRDNLKPVTVSIDDDHLTLKWAIFLAGYGLAPDDLFDPKYSNDVFLGRLFQHDVPEISEYSVWALWERPEFTDRHLSVEFDVARKAPENVRKWLYRLFTQSHMSNGLDYDIVQQMWTSDRSSAREGLARGLVDANHEKFDDAIVEWSGIENDHTIRQILLEGMARRSDSNEIMFELANKAYDTSTSMQLRSSIVAASAGTRLYTEIKRREIAAGNEAQSTFNFEPGSQPQFVIGDKAQMSNLNVGGNLNAQNVAVGDMLNSANDAVQHMSVEQNSDKAVLSKVMEFLQANFADSESSKPVLAAIAAAAKVPTPENKRSLLNSFKALASGGATAASAGGGIASIIQLLSTWAG